MIFFKTVINQGILTSGFATNNSTLSAYRQIFCSKPLNLIPFIPCSSLINCAMGSINKAKRAGLGGQPWHQPLSRLILLSEMPVDPYSGIR